MDELNQRLDQPPPGSSPSPGTWGSPPFPTWPRGTASGSGSVPAHRRGCPPWSGCPIRSSGTSRFPRPTCAAPASSAASRCQGGRQPPAAGQAARPGRRTMLWLTAKHPSDRRSQDESVISEASAKAGRKRRPQKTRSHQPVDRIQPRAASGQPGRQPAAPPGTGRADRQGAAAAHAQGSNAYPGSGDSGARLGCGHARSDGRHARVGCRYSRACRRLRQDAAPTAHGPLPLPPVRLAVRAST